MIGDAPDMYELSFDGDVGATQITNLACINSNSSRLGLGINTKILILRAQ